MFYDTAACRDDFELIDIILSFIKFMQFEYKPKAGFYRPKVNVNIKNKSVNFFNTRSKSQLVKVAKLATSTFDLLMKVQLIVHL